MIFLIFYLLKLQQKTPCCNLQWSWKNFFNVLYAKGHSMNFNWSRLEIKSNYSTRICFSVMKTRQSRQILTFLLNFLSRETTKRPSNFSAYLKFVKPRQKHHQFVCANSFDYLHSSSMYVNDKSKNQYLPKNIFVVMKLICELLWHACKELVENSPTRSSFVDCTMRVFINSFCNLRLYHETCQLCSTKLLQVVRALQFDFAIDFKWRANY